MLRSLFSGVTGMRAHQTMMDVVGNNIANVNTAGYKSSQVVFEDTLSQMLKAAGAPQGGNGGTNPAQVGLGVNIGAIVTNYAQGATQLTGRSTDMAIQGDGFFEVNKGGEQLYTRAGAFSFDSNGKLVTPEGAVVQGWMGTKGVIDTNQPVTDIQLPMGTLLDPQRTQNMTMSGNLPNDAASGTAITRSMNIYDGQGAAYSASVTYTKNATANQWDVTLALTDPSGAAVSPAPTLSPASITFDPATGKLATPATPSQLAFTLPGAAGGAINIDVSGMSQMGSDNTVEATKQDGSTMGSLQSFTISPDGTLVGVFSNGLKQPLGQIALASFNNPPGLEKVGNSLLRSSVNSGNPNLGVAGSAGRGTLASGTLEMSNVDLAQEFTNLIVAERGFQANSKVITTSDQILQDLVNLKQ